MYTSDSQKFSQEFKEKALAAIKKQIQAFDSMPITAFADIVSKDTGTDYGMSEVKGYGRRWKDTEQVYQSMIMVLWDKLLKERGPGMMTDQEAQALENMFLLPTTEYMFDVIAKEAVARAAGTDHWYMFEKQWD